MSSQGDLAELAVRDHAEPPLIEIVEATGSTNDDMRQRLRDAEAIPPGLWLVADRQSAGRGRMGRAWFDGYGNFMGSTVIALRAKDPPVASLSLVAGVAVWNTVATFLPDRSRAVLKWPNDLLIKEAKCAGILLEREGDSVVMGIGVNLLHAPAVEGRATTAIADHAPSPDRNVFAKQLADQVTLELDHWRRVGVTAYVERWMALAHPVGTPLSVTNGDGSVLDGRFAGLDSHGALLLASADDAVQTIYAGDVLLANEKR